MSTFRQHMERYFIRISSRNNSEQQMQQDTSNQQNLIDIEQQQQRSDAQANNSQDTSQSQDNQNQQNNENEPEDGTRDSSYDSGVENSDYVVSPPRRSRREITNTTMQDILSLLVGTQSQDTERNFQSNTSLVSFLKSEEIVSSQTVLEAMKICDRGIFIPRENSNQAYIDSPLRVISYNINISAPHMHGSMLERLNVQPGESVLDVGSGCGIVSAYLSVLVGKAGRVTGVEIKDRVLQLSQDNMEILKRDCKQYTDVASNVELLSQNAFLPSNLYGQFDKVYVGASCPEERILGLLSYLKPTGGTLIVPVMQDRTTEMKLVTKKPKQEPKYQSFEQVAFSQLEIPCDAEIVLKSMELEKSKSSRIQIPPSTYKSDAYVIRKSSMSFSPDERGSGFSHLMRSQSERKSWGLNDINKDSMAHFNNINNSSYSYNNHNSSNDNNIDNSITGNSSSQGGWVGGCSPQSMFSCQTQDDMEMFQSDIQEDEDKDLKDALGAHDCVLVGTDFSLMAHKNVLKHRCEHFKARFESGMRDADVDTLEVPDNFTKESLTIFLDYLYFDEHKLELDADMSFQLLHVATYYGVPRLIVLCEQILAEELGKVEDNVGAEAAVNLLQLADENGLTHLRNSVLSYIVFNFDKVSKTPQYSQLNLDQIRTIAMLQNQLFTRQTEILKTLCNKTVQN